MARTTPTPTPSSRRFERPVPHRLAGAARLFRAPAPEPAPAHAGPRSVHSLLSLVTLLSLLGLLALGIALGAEATSALPR